MDPSLFYVFLTHVNWAKLQLADSGRSRCLATAPLGLISPDFHTAVKRRRPAESCCERGRHTRGRWGRWMSPPAQPPLWAPGPAKAAPAQTDCCPRWGIRQPLLAQVPRPQLWRHKRQSLGPQRAPQRLLGAQAKHTDQKCTELWLEKEIPGFKTCYCIGRAGTKWDAAGGLPRILPACVLPHGDPQKC